MLYAFPKTTDKPCPTGWAPQWDTWGQIETCNAAVAYDTKLGGYPLTYIDVINIANAHAASTPTTPTVGSGDQVIEISGQQWRAATLQATTYKSGTAALNRVGRPIAQRLSTQLLANPDAIVHITAGGKNKKMRAKRTRHLVTYLTRKGVSRDRIFIINKKRRGVQVQASVYLPDPGWATTLSKTTTPIPGR